MRLPELSALSSSRKAITTFGGYNHTESCSDGEWYDEENVCSDDYPCLRQRDGRERLVTQQDYSWLVNFKTLRVYGKGPVNEDTDRIVDMIWNDGWYCISEYYDDSGNIHCRFFKMDNEGNITVRLLDRFDKWVDFHRGKMVVNGGYIIIFTNTHNSTDGRLDSFKIKTTTPTTGTSGDGLHITKFAEYTVLEQKNSVSTEITVFPCTEDDVSLQATIKTSQPFSPSVGDCWINTKTPTGSTPEVKRWDGSEWDTIASNYVALKATGIAQGLNEGDTVQINFTGSGIAVNKTKSQYSAGQFRKGLKGNYFYLYKVDTDNDIIAFQCTYRDFCGTITIPSGSSVDIVRNVPDFDYVVEAENRIWGCRYSRTDGINELYCCKQGDPENWYSQANVSLDSWSTSLGDAGDFTGATVMNGYPFFFKDGICLKILGSYPSQYQLNRTADFDGPISAGTIAQYGGYMYYRGKRGIMRYSGSYAPECISENLKGVNEAWKAWQGKTLTINSKPTNYSIIPKEAITADEVTEWAARDDSEKYVIINERRLKISNIVNDGNESVVTFAKKITDLSVGTEIKNYNGRCHYPETAAVFEGKYYAVLDDLEHDVDSGIFVYDIEKGVWHRHANKESSGKLVAGGNKLVCFNPGENGRTIIAGAKPGAEEKPIPWYVVSGKMLMETVDRKYVNRADIRITLEPETWFKAYIMYDETGEWKELTTIRATALKTFTLPVRIRRCDHFRIKLEGEGNFMLYGITLDIETGSNL